MMMIIMFEVGISFEEAGIDRNPKADKRQIPEARL